MIESLRPLARAGRVKAAKVRRPRGEVPAVPRGATSIVVHRFTRARSRRNPCVSAKRPGCAFQCRHHTSPRRHALVGTIEPFVGDSCDRRHVDYSRRIGRAVFCCSRWSTAPVVSWFKSWLHRSAARFESSVGLFPGRCLRHCVFTLVEVVSQIYRLSPPRWFHKRPLSFSSTEKATAFVCSVNQWISTSSC